MDTHRTRPVYKIRNDKDKKDDEGELVRRMGNQKEGWYKVKFSAVLRLKKLMGLLSRSLSFPDTLGQRANNFCYRPQDTNSIRHDRLDEWRDHGCRGVRNATSKGKSSPLLPPNRSTRHQTEVSGLRRRRRGRKERSPESR